MRMNFIAHTMFEIEMHLAIRFTQGIMLSDKSCVANRPDFSGNE